MKLPCTLNKFFIFEGIFSENEFMSDWQLLSHISEKIRIDGTIANSLEKLQLFFPYSKIYVNSMCDISQKQEDLLINQDILCGRFRLIFYEDFEYNYKIYFNEKNTYITLQISYPKKEISDPRQKFIAGVILDNYRKLFSPVT